MKSDLQALREFGDRLKPSVEQPPATVRHRVLTTVRQTRPGLTRRTLRSRWPYSPRWRLLAGVATAMVAAMAMTALTLPGVSREEPMPADPHVVAQTPEQFLELVAARAAAAPALTPRGDQYVFTEWIEVVQRFRVRGSHIVASVDAPEMVREWRSADGIGRGLVQRRSEVGVWHDAPTKPCSQDSDGRAQAREPGIDECGLDAGRRASLPTDGDAMFDYLYRSSELPDDLSSVVGADVAALARAAQILRLGGLSPRVQVAVFDAIGRMPGVQVKTDAIDVSGRSGLALVFTGLGGHTELIFDSHTYEYQGMNQEIVTVWRPLPGSKVTWVVADTPIRQAVLRVAIVNDVGRLP